MNKEFAAYLLTLSDIGKNIWLRIYIESAANGTAIINEKELMQEFDVSKNTWDVHFKPDLAEKKNLIKVQRISNRLVIMFGRPGRKTNVDKAVELEVKKEQKLLAKETPVEVLPAVTEKSLSIHTMPGQWVFTHELRVKLIEDYIYFYKNRQRLAAMMLGKDPNSIDPIAPKIAEVEVVSLRRIASHFHSIGCHDNESVQSAFRKIYNHWETLPDFYRNSPTPDQIYRHLNSIISHITTHPITNQTKQNKKDVKFNSAINQAGKKDYSHMERRGKKDN